ncbi:hypothetical protein, partial [Shewanella colwelliana]|uniref:hypothetical protein n=1 Tax=Shewanella colwelliana TaxID=23 RepID=UPI001C7D8896
MTNIKSVVGKVSLTALSLVLFFLLTAYAESLYSWYQWWSDGAAPIELEVKVKRIQALTGRDRGSQFFYVENSEGGYRLDSKFSSKESK